MAVLLNVRARVQGARNLRELNRSVRGLGRGAAVARLQMQSLENAAARGRATFGFLRTSITVATAALGAFAAIAIGSFIRSTIQIGNEVEGLQVRFEALFGSVEEGGRAFEQLRQFAETVPFGFREIQNASGNLAVVSADAIELRRNLEITANVAAATGLDFRQTAEQIQRSFAGGIAAADVFRERGVRAMLGFEAGVTVSVEDTIARFEEVFGPGGRLGNVADALAQTLSGRFSLVGDAYDQLRIRASEPLFEELVGELENVLQSIEDNQEAVDDFARSLGGSLAEGFRNLTDAIRFTITNWASLEFAIQAIIALRIVRAIHGITAALTLHRIQVLASTGAWTLFTAAIRANPIGLVLSVVAAGVSTLILFNDELDKIINFFARFNPSSLASAAEAAEATADAYQESLDAVRAIVAEQDRLARSAMNAAAAALEQRRALFDTAETTRRNNVRTIIQNDRLQRQYEDIRNFNREQIQLEARKARAITQGIENVRRAAVEARRSFQEIVRAAELEEQERLIRAQEDAWRDVQRTIDEGARRSVDGLFDAIQNGESVFESLKNVALQALNDIARAAASRALSDIFSGGNRGDDGSSVGGLGGIISAGRRILGFNEGGIVPGVGNTDSVPALLTPGELVVPREEVNSYQNQRPNITNINISGNVDQRSIDQIREVISTSPSQVGGSNRQYSNNSNGLKSRNS